MGAVEEALKLEIGETTGNSVLHELAYKLAREIDMDSGGVAAIRELRTIVNELKPRSWGIDGYSRSTLEDWGDIEEVEGPIESYIIKDGVKRVFRNWEWVPEEEAEPLPAA